MDIHVGQSLLELASLVAVLSTLVCFLRTSRGGMLISTLALGAIQLAKLIIWVRVGYAWDVPAVIFGTGAFISFFATAWYWPFTTPTAPVTSRNQSGEKP